MRNLALLLLLAVVALSALAQRSVTVAQLEQVLATVHGKPDAKVAQQLSDLELAERLSMASLSRWESSLPGPESRRSLVILADMSAFLNPPADEIPATATLDLGAQRQLMARTVDYASKTIRQLPNFFATRDTIRFEATAPGHQAGTSLIPAEPLHPVSRSTDTVLYRNGEEVVSSETAKGKESESETSGLTTSGIFGPILATVLVDAAHSKLVWDRWEQGTAGSLAVFRYAVPREKSHYQVGFCCVFRDNVSQVFQQFSGYHGVIAVDPTNGTILRLTLEADLRPSDPIVRSDILVEYGPVEIGGRTYVCPVKGVSILLAPTAPSDSKRLKTLLNDVAFVQYHLFRADARLLTAGNADTYRNTPAPAPVDMSREELAATPGQKETSVAGDHASLASTESSVPITSVVPAATSVPAPAPAPESAAPEISVAETSGLPDVSTPGSAQEKGFTLRVTTRLVDVGVMAFDRKGHPVMDLKREDFEIDDNGRKQAVRFFSQAGGNSANESDAVGQPGFSNRHADSVDTKSGSGATENIFTILMIDPSGLAWSDLAYARDEMLKFLRTLPASQRVGLYVMKGQGFDVLEEATADHALLASKLSQWLPTAQDLARAQELEWHNRQQFDEVRSQTDLQYVNGNSNSAPETVNPVDPQLRDDGATSGRDTQALRILVGVARHLATLPGHKNLVWVTSDNVLADWTDKAVSGDKGSRHIDSLLLHAQEGLNDAHVSLYPLDASKLETMAIDPSLENRNIQLAPGSIGSPPPQSGGAQAGRVTAAMQQDVRPIQPSIQEMAEATGGLAFPRSGNLAARLNEVVEDGQAAYLLSFVPDVPADDKYHQLTAKVTTRRGVTLRYRTGYQYATEPSTLKDRFRQAIWQPLDANEIALSANPVATAKGVTLKLSIAVNDLALKLQNDRWMDKLDIFVVQRDNIGLHARITGQTLGLALKPVTYQSLSVGGIPFDEVIEKPQDAGSLRIVVVDENSGRMGSITIPAGIQGKL
jgi:VWFA-related protein